MSELPVAPVGAHVPVSGGLATRGLSYTAEIDAETIQVFVGNPRGWATSAGDPNEDARIRERTDLPVFIHSPYLINLGTPDEDAANRSVGALRHCLRRGREIGARGVVVHTGSAVRGGREAGLDRMRTRLLPLLRELDEDDPRVLLEPMAGKGQTLCATVDDLVAYLDAVEWHDRARVCLDTAHAFAAGHDIASREGMRAMLDRFSEVVGAARLDLVHANDSKASCGSNQDLHQNIGDGQIGAEPFGELFRHSVSAGVPLTCETPGPEKPHATDVATLKKLRSGT